jgi:hypothetical protein
MALWVVLFLGGHELNIRKLMPEKALVLRI